MLSIGTNFRPRNDYPSMLDAALDYLQMGFEIIPAHSPLMFSKRGNTKWGRLLIGTPGKIPLRPWFDLRPLKSEKEVRYWWGRYPNANILLCLGKKAGVVALDVDNAMQPEAALLVLNLPPTLRSQTGNGEHWYFLHPLQENKILSVKNGILGKLTLISEDCATIAPPSLHATGKRYRWLNPDMPAAALPDSLRKLIPKKNPYLLWLWRVKRIIKLWLRLPLYYFAFALRDACDGITGSNDKESSGPRP